jgi:hypothetical protein
MRRFEAPARLQSGDCFYDIEHAVISHRGRGDGDHKTADPAQEFIDDHSSYVHEQHHFTTAVGSSIGCLLNLLRHDRLLSGVSWFVRLSRAEKDHLIEQRRPQNGRPIVEPFTNGRCLLGLRVERDGEGEPIWMLQRILFENAVTWNFLYEQGDIRGLVYRLRPECIFSLALRDAAIRANKLHNAGWPELDESSIRDPSGYYQTPRSGALNTRTLLEGMAVANELLFLKIGGAPRQHQTTRLANIMSTTYGIALRLYLQRLQRTFDDLMTNPIPLIGWFLLICDVALNPLVPPFTFPATAVVPTITDLLPQTRFLRLLTILPALISYATGADDLATDAWVAYQYQGLSEAAGYPSPLGLAFPHPARGSSGDLHDIHSDVVLSGERDLDERRIHELLDRRLPAYAYLAWFSSLAWRMRSTNLSEVIFPGLYHGRLADLDGGPFIVRASKVQAEKLHFAPLRMNPHNGRLSVGWCTDANHATVFAKTLLHEHLTHELFFGMGSPQPGIFAKANEFRQESLTQIATEMASQLGTLPPW